MQPDKIFKNALIFSIILHMFIFIGLPKIGDMKRCDIQDDTELTFLPDKKIPIDSNLIAEKQTKNPLSSLPGIESTHERIEKREQPVRPFTPRQAHETIKVNVSDKPELIHSEKPVSDDNMLISYQEKDLSSDPIYLDYYNAVRSRIYKSAQNNRPYYFAEGGVSLVFTLSKTGSLVSVGIIPEKSTNNPTLQRHALVSIERAGPFAPFHESMQQQELTLRITISFEK